jgi:hypothetical protein
MVIPSHPDQHDDAAPLKNPPTRRTKLAIALIVVILATFIALHLAGVFGP